MKLLFALVSFVFFSMSLNTLGQTQVNIEYDFVTKKLDRPSFIKEGSPVVIIYKNVNKFALKSSASLTSGNRSYDDGLSQLQAGLLKLAGEKEKTDDKKKETVAEINALPSVSPRLPAARSNDLSNFKTYLENKIVLLGDIKREFNYIYDEVLKINGIMLMDKDIIAAAGDPHLNTQALLEGTIFIQSATTGVSAPADFTSSLNGSISNIRISLTNIADYLIILKGNVATSGLTALQQKEENAKVDEFISEINKKTTVFESAYEGQNLKILQDNAADMGRRALKLVTQDFTISPSVVGTADGDYVEISDKLTDNDGKLIMEIKPFKINTCGGSRVDFSIGLSVNIGGMGKYKYDLRKNPTNATSGTAVDSVILLSDDEDRLFKFNPTIFVHWYINTTKKVQWMVSTGITPDFTDMTDSRLSVGTSFGFPSSNNLSRRLLFGTGISFGYADVLKTKYKGLSDFRSFGDLAVTDLTEKSLKMGAFFSVSYNLGGTGH